MLIHMKKLCYYLSSTFLVFCLQFVIHQILFIDKLQCEGQNGVYMRD